MTPSWPVFPALEKGSRLSALRRFECDHLISTGTEDAKPVARQEAATEESFSRPENTGHSGECPVLDCLLASKKKNLKPGYTFGLAWQSSDELH
jgi:hypothetical protein